ncbi:MAG: biotin--[acetyl-CoA-carboxylase] ligase [Muribaculaceae bacterium]|nr:biotin--[acetyl-CoA-carboxylase] ligase [Muribaculaceae bacterium]
MKTVCLDSTDSTNSWVALHEKELEPTSLVYCLNQTAGRGQRGNSWESQPGMNITASLIFHPENFPAARQFAISEAIALAIVEFISLFGVEAKVKWPNDIYVGDRKICGILVEHSVTRREISRTIAGFGININQTRFLSDAPNPVSLAQITGETYSLESCIAALAPILERHIQNLSHQESLHADFLRLLWRNDGHPYLFFDKKNNKPLHAFISNVEPDGTLRLLSSDGATHSFAFKEVEFILETPSDDC